MSEERTTTPDPTADAVALGRRVRFSMVAMAVVGGLFAVGGAVVFGWRAGLSVAAGTAIAVSNFYVLARVVSAIAADTKDDADARRGTRLWVTIALLKLAVLFGGVYVLIHFDIVLPLALTVGLGALPIGIATSSLVRDTQGAA